MAVSTKVVRCSYCRVFPKTQYDPCSDSRWLMCPKCTRRSRKIHFDTPLYHVCEDWNDKHRSSYAAPHPLEKRCKDLEHRVKSLEASLTSVLSALQDQEEKIDALGSPLNIADIKKSGDLF